MTSPAWDLSVVHISGSMIILQSSTRSAVFQETFSHPTNWELNPGSCVCRLTWHFLNCSVPPNTVHSTKTKSTPWGQGLRHYYHRNKPCTARPRTEDRKDRLWPLHRCDFICLSQETWRDSLLPLFDRENSPRDTAAHGQETQESCLSLKSTSKILSLHPDCRIWPLCSCKPHPRLQHTRLTLKRFWRYSSSRQNLLCAESILTPIPASYTHIWFPSLLKRQTDVIKGPLWELHKAM